MTNKPKLNPQILDYLHDRLPKSVSTIRSEISVLRRHYPQAPLNAVAQLYAQQHGESVRRLVPKQDRALIPSVTFEKPPSLKTKKKPRAKGRTKPIIQFETDDYFLRKHIEEINKAYDKHCYTCVFVLVRKVFENLIIAILKSKFRANPELYFDKIRGRNQDFSIVLQNLFDKRNDFDDDRKRAIERLNDKLKPFKTDANDKAHSLYHIVENPKEVDDWNLETIMALIKAIA